MEAEVAGLRKEIEIQAEQNEMLDKFIQKAKKYTGITALDAYTLHGLVSALYVDAPDKNSGKRRQHIHIKYDMPGLIPQDGQGETA